jgi:hypothetical protein
MDMTLKVQLRNTWGTYRVYPLNETAKKIAGLLLNQKTFTESDIEKLKSIGFKIQWVASEF